MGADVAAAEWYFTSVVWLVGVWPHAGWMDGGMEGWKVACGKWKLTCYSAQEKPPSLPIP